MLAVAFHAKKLHLYPESETLFVCNYKFATDLLDQALANIDTSPWDTQPIGQQETVTTCCRTTACALRLFVLLLVDDALFDRLINESARGPMTRANLDVSAVGDNSNFWVDICAAFVDDVYPMPPIPTNNHTFIDRATRINYDISLCSSKWATPGKLCKWYNTAHNLLIMYRLKYDTSGNHDFDSDAGLAEFVSKFYHGNRDCMFLAALANWRGDSALEWFSGRLPKNVQVVDGFDIPLSTFRQPSLSGLLVGTKRMRVDDNSETQNSQIMGSGSKRGSNESPAKRDYFRAKAKVLAVVELTKKWEASVALAQSFTAAGEKILPTTDHKEQVKKRLMQVSLRMLSKLMDNVEGSIDEEEGRALLEE
jgi:hypothetical protein